MTLRSANSVLSVQRKPNELVQMKLLYSMCVPILSHTAEVKVFKYKDMHNCNVALNDAIQRIFSFRLEKQSLKRVAATPLMP